MNTRTNIVLDDALIAQAMARAKVTTKKAAVEAALRAYVRKPDYAGLLALRGSGAIADDYDPKGAYGGHANWADMPGSAASSQAKKPSKTATPRKLPAAVTRKRTARRKVASAA